VSDFSIDAMVRDYEAVVERVAPDGPVWLLAQATASPVAMAFAARNPERVSKLVLWLPFSCGADIDTREWHGFIELAERDWELAWQTLPNAMTAWEDPAAAKIGGEIIRRSMTSEGYVACARAMQKWDVRKELARIQCPTLVVHRREHRYFRLEGAQGVAAAIPNASFKVFEGASGLPDNDVLMAMLSFLVAAEAAEALQAIALPASGTREPTTDLRTVLFTDLVGHTEMMRRLGDEKGREVLREHERITREVLKAHGGTEVKTMGDGFMASFGSVTKAVECAVALQRAMDEHNRGVGAQHAAPLHVRIGLNAGEPIEEDGDLFGSTVILASRIAGKAEGGEILASLAVRELCSGKGFLFADRGEFVAKGFEEPVRVFEVRWRE
jgi:class 3 adenylate cyclase